MSFALRRIYIWMMHARSASLVPLPALMLTLLSVGCGDDVVGNDEVGDMGDSGSSSSSGGTVDGTETATGTMDTDTSTTGTSSTDTSTTSSSTDTSSSDSSDDGTKFDLLPGLDQEILPPSCTVPEGELDAVPECEQSAPADSFEPAVQWEWYGEGLHVNSLTTPLVANLTDDNDDGAVDLCDIPDIVILTHEGLSNNPEHLWVLDGAEGDIHWDLDLGLTFSQVPAIGDVDGDGLPEIVAGTASNQLVIVGNDGVIELQKSVPWLSSYRPAFGLADFDNDGDVEIFLGNGLLDHQGNVIFQKAGETLNFYHASAAADLDGDGDLELLVL
ncbi:MAG: VCBS repeat-containing protein, partial [Myxococcales bacterium]|nr:VCBS repeat-containing protein [Myxococcales bacterium]